MALRSTVFKVEVQVADMDRHHYQTHALTVARHPSETDERMMVRVLAFALYADETLCFGRGLSDEDDPALYRNDLTGAMTLWIHVGLPDEKAIRKSCSRAAEVVVLSYGGASARIWWEKNRDRLALLDNLTVLNLAPAESKVLAELVDRTMVLQVAIQDGAVLVTGEGHAIEVHPQEWRRAAAEGRE